MEGSGSSNGGSSDGGPGFRIALQLLGATAGLTAFTALVGGSMLWLRFDALALPADRALELMPRSLLLTVGLHALVPSILLGLVVVVLLWLAWPLRDVSRDETRSWQGLVFFAVLVALAGWAIYSVAKGADQRAIWITIGIAALLLARVFGRRWPALNEDVKSLEQAFTSLGREMAWNRWFLLILATLLLAYPLTVLDGLVVIPWAVVLVGGLAIGVGAIGHTLRLGAAQAGGQMFARAAWTMFAVIVALGGLMSFVRTASSPKLEPAAVLLKGKTGGVSGFLIEQTDERIYIAPLPGNGDLSDPFADADVDRLLEIPREQVVRLAVRHPAGLRPNEIGRQEAIGLLADLKLQQNASRATLPVIVPTTNPIRTFAPLVNLSSDERYLPMTVKAFLEDSSLKWRNGACDSNDVVLERGEIQSGGEVKAGGSKTPIGSAAGKPGGPGLVSHRLLDQNCAPGERSYTTAKQTRPYDRKRAEGLPRSDGFFLHPSDPTPDGYKAGVKDEDPQDLFVDVPVYYEAHPVRVGAGGTQEITYWFFYGNSQPPGTEGRAFAHQGDWERIMVTVEATENPGEWIPATVRYYYHDQHRDVPWAVVVRIGEGNGQATHPVVYSARGSHASYPRFGDYTQALVKDFLKPNQEVIRVSDHANACPGCPVWRTWLDMVDALDESWYGFGGAWGDATDSSDTTAPLGPSSYKLDSSNREQRTIETVRKSSSSED